MSEGAHSGDGVAVIAGLSEECDALLGELFSALEIAFLDCRDTEHVEIERGGAEIAKAVMKVECLLGERAGRRHVGAAVGH